MRPDDDDDEIPKRILAFEATEDEVIAWYMRGVLERAGGNQCEAQRVLAIDRSTIRRRIEKLGLRRPSPSNNRTRANGQGQGRSRGGRSGRTPARTGTGRASR